ncbi:MAG: hypothetical protein HY554_09805 [Elusimicrobia bacterium]|nr:hypothetical protein [Elusimicrobiota bacterium]
MNAWLLAAAASACPLFAASPRTPAPPDPVAALGESRDLPGKARNALILSRGALRLGKASPSLRASLKRALLGLSLRESRAYMDEVRRLGLVRRLVEALLVTRDAVHRDALVDRWTAVLSGTAADPLVEVLTYVDYLSTNHSALYGLYDPSRRVVDIADYAQRADAILHESCHGFMHAHGLPASDLGLNEGLCIALPKLVDDGATNIAEPVFGTVLYYRDVGLEGYPRNVSIGDPGKLDAKGRELVRELMLFDASGLDWFDPGQVRCVYERLWSQLDRRLPWDLWVKAAAQATADAGKSGCLGASAEPTEPVMANELRHWFAEAARRERDAGKRRGFERKSHAYSDLILRASIADAYALEIASGWQLGRDDAAAIENLVAAAMRYPQFKSLAAACLWKAGTLALRLGRHAEAEDRFRTVQAMGPEVEAYRDLARRELSALAGTGGD